MPIPHEHVRHDDLPSVEPESTNWRAWLLGACFTLILALGGAGYQSLQRRIDTLELYGSPMLRERIAALEVQQHALQRQQDNDIQVMRDTIKRIEAKLDITLDRLQKHMEKNGGG